MPDTYDTVKLLLDALADDLLSKIKSGDATAADLNVARQLLKDNGINCIPTKNNGIGKLAEALPFQSAEEIAEDHDNFH